MVGECNEQDDTDITRYLVIFTTSVSGNGKYITNSLWTLGKRKQNRLHSGGRLQVT